MQKFAQEFNTLHYVIREAENILLFAHSSPDGDTTGSVLALQEYIRALGKQADIACYDPFPEYLKSLAGETFHNPETLNLQKYTLIIAADSVERGFHKIQKTLQENQIVALLDHHPDITIQGDINIVDASYSSVCELVYDFLFFNKIEINRKMATYILLGLMADTGSFQHSNTNSKVIEKASQLIKKGAPISKIVETTFSNKSISTLKLWGKAFEKAKIDSTTGMIISVLTKKDLEECHAGTEDIAQVASILNTVPDTKFSLILSERDNGVIKGSLRSEEYKGVNVSEIAAQFGGGGHKLASGFEIKGTIKETADGWEIL